MTLTRDDLRAAVSTGTISESQAVGIIALAEARQGMRENLEGLDEPFELFKGFNEIFIIVGLVILYTGWVALSGLGFFMAASDGSLGMTMAAAFTLVVLAGLSGYFTLKRRMVGPSIALAVMTGISGGQLGLALGVGMADTIAGIASIAGAIATVVLTAYWVMFRVPFAMPLIALSVFATLFALTIMGGADLNQPQDVFLLTADGPFSILTIALGLIGLAIALRFDMSDPHRVTRRAANGFWLHVIAAPAIVNTIALTLFQIGTPLAFGTLLAFIALMALFAIVIDRRSFLVSGIGYVVAMFTIVAEGQAALIIVILGAGLVLLGAQWEKLRSVLMRGLPAFPGKNRLPPWADMKGL